MTFSVRVMFNERSDLFPLLNKIFLLLSSTNCIESLLSMNHSQRLLKYWHNNLNFLSMNLTLGWL